MSTPALIAIVLAMMCLDQLPTLAVLDTLSRMGYNEVWVDEHASPFVTAATVTPRQLVAAGITISHVIAVQGALNLLVRIDANGTCV